VSIRNCLRQQQTFNKIQIYNVAIFVGANKKMGNIPPCTPDVNQLALGTFVLVNLYACDAWAVPHVIMPFILTVWAKDFGVGWLFAYINEGVEAWFNIFFATFVLFVDANHDGENLAGSLIDDAWIQGLVGATLGVLFLWAMPTPRLLSIRDFIPLKKGHVRLDRFVYWVLMLILVASPATLYRVKIGTFPLGILVYPFLQGAFLWIANRFAPAETWAGYRRSQVREYWFTIWLFSLAINIQNMFDYFYSSAVQSWIWSGLFGVYLIIRIVQNRRHISVVYEKNK
jgi:hypothetical protein